MAADVLVPPIPFWMLPSSGVYHIRLRGAWRRASSTTTRWRFWYATANAMLLRNAVKSQPRADTRVACGPWVCAAVFRQAVHEPKAHDAVAGAPATGEGARLVSIRFDRRQADTAKPDPAGLEGRCEVRPQTYQLTHRHRA